MTARHAKHPAASKSAKSLSAPKAGRPFAPGYGIVGPKDGKGLLPWSWVTRKMNSCRTFWLATIHTALDTNLKNTNLQNKDAEPRPHVMPVWGVWLDDAFFFSTGRNSRKGQNLAANPACTITNDDGAEAVVIEGRATEVEVKVKDAAQLERIAVAYKKKYKMDPRSMKEPIFRVRPKTIFGFIEKTFPKSATRWKF